MTTHGWTCIDVSYKAVEELTGTDHQDDSEPALAGKAFTPGWQLER